jgi:hypothetical protein
LSKPGVSRGDDLLLGAGVYLEDLVEVPPPLATGKTSLSPEPLEEWVPPASNVPWHTSRALLAVRG